MLVAVSVGVSVGVEKVHNLAYMCMKCTCMHAYTRTCIHMCSSQKARWSSSCWCSNVVVVVVSPHVYT